MVEDLVREFVPEALATDLDFTGLQRVNPKFHTGRRPAQRRESDVIWKLPTSEGADTYLLIEFQSTIDRWMAVRTQVYEGLLWQQVLDEKELKTGAQLPPLLLIVLYNGVSRWSVPSEIRELFALSSDSPLWPWQPQVRYYLLDVGAVPGEKLARRASPATLLFRLEQRPSFEEIKELIVEAGGWFREHPDYTELRRLFFELVHRASIGFEIDRPISEDLLMFKSNLDTLGETWRQQWKAEGLAQSEAKWKADSLVRLLAGRFGAVKPSLLKRIRAANPATLDCWFERAIAAPDLRSVFEPLREIA
jgi:Putative transposase, YhgA-like